MAEQNAMAPRGVENAFAASFDFWWYDTTGSLLSTAISGIFVALSGAFTVLLMSTRSFVITMFAVFTIAYILATVAALLVASDWTMGLYVIIQVMNFSGLAYHLRLLALKRFVLRF